MPQNQESGNVNLLRQVRILQACAVLFAVLLAVALIRPFRRTEGKAKFGEIEVGRINVVEPDGTLRLAVFSNAKSPGLVLDGKYLAEREGKRGAGLMFYNLKGDECGGLTYNAGGPEGGPEAGAMLAFDQFRQDQVVALTYSDSKSGRRAGLRVWDRPDTPLLELGEKVEAVKAMAEGPEKAAAMQKLQQAVAAGEFGADRVFVGRGAKGEAAIVLADRQSKPRIVMSVDGDGAPKLEFLDQAGNVIDRLPRDPAPAGKR